LPLIRHLGFVVFNPPISKEKRKEKEKKKKKERTGKERKEREKSKDLSGFEHL
jgi:hypothetical protein